MSNRELDILVFGAMGNLMEKKLGPALMKLLDRGDLPAKTRLVGINPERTQGEFETRMKEIARAAAEGSVHASAREMEWVFMERASKSLAKKGKANRIIYLAVPPISYSSIIKELREKNLIHESGTKEPWTRLVLEKPFGSDKKTAKELQARLVSCGLKEEHIFRIDHYLGKETVQNILAFRFANTILVRDWRGSNFDHIQITVSEADGVPRHRIPYYDGTGAMRDMIQNHLLQLFCLVAMGPPVSNDASDIQARKLEALRRAWLHIQKRVGEKKPPNYVRGQYKRGVVNGQYETGYEGSSETETFVALELGVGGGGGLSGVPFYLRTGKRMHHRFSEIMIAFKEARDDTLFGEQQLPKNVLTLRIQPDEGFSVDVGCKVPGQGMRIEPVRMDFRYSGQFYGRPVLKEYERLLVDIVNGDQTLFPSWGEILYSWRIVDYFRSRWKDEKPTSYYSGTWGPREADELLGDERNWHNPTLS
ncbi:MAG: glucose-6-phosphate dehydrogenase [bacterium]|nr:glucose-6-phosphate dehydrogenase [bacterium]